MKIVGESFVGIATAAIRDDKYLTTPKNKTVNW
jgi:hypothetical protein